MWVTQGWFLYSVPQLPWGVPQAKAFLTAPPKGKLVVLDLDAVEKPVWSRTESFYGASFAFNMLHNFGERPGLFGHLQQIGHVTQDALAQSVAGTDVGIGLSPEGTGTNPAVYDLFMSNMWAGVAPINVTSWVQAYARRRYGLSMDGTTACDHHATNAWALLQRSVYHAPDGWSEGATGSDMAARPTLAGGKIPDTTDAIFYNATDVEAAWSELLQCASLGDAVDGYGFDLVAVGRQVLSDRFNAARKTFAAAATPALQPGSSHCQHFTAADKHACATLPKARQLQCAVATCEQKYDAVFTHDTDGNEAYPGCSTCWCCKQGGLAKGLPKGL